MHYIMSSNYFVFLSRIPFVKNGLLNAHRLNALEVKNKVKFLEGVKMLDVGCGGGILSEV